MDKKGFFVIADLVAIGVIFLLLVIFLVIFGAHGFWSNIVGGGEETIISQKIEDRYDVFYTIMKIPVEVDDREMLLSDLVVLSIDNGDYEKLESVLSSELDDFGIIWYFEFSDADNLEGSGKVLAHQNYLFHVRHPKEIIIPGYFDGVENVRVLFNFDVAQFAHPA
tara:strand:+ start:127 stop:624 length:498 start_codon:yes stop_codon:yes gene_type:complete